MKRFLARRRKDAWHNIRFVSLHWRSSCEETSHLQVPKPMHLNLFHPNITLADFRYPGTDDRSPWYNYVLSPAAVWLVNRLPRWLAPNTITISGLMLMVLSYIVSATYCPSFDNESPRWTYFLSATCILTYQFLDVCDGKQARRDRQVTRGVISSSL